MRSWRATRGLPKKPSTDPHHHANALVIKRTHLGVFHHFGSKSQLRPALGSSLAPIRRQFPRHPRQQISNDDLLASIDRTDQHLANCLSLAESALAMIEDRSPPEVGLVRERLARAKARIMGEMSAIISLFLLDFTLKIFYHSFLEYFRSNCSVGESSISRGSCGRI